MNRFIFKGMLCAALLLVFSCGCSAKGDTGRQKTHDSADSTKQATPHAETKDTTTTWTDTQNTSDKSSLKVKDDSTEVKNKPAQTQDKGTTKTDRHNSMKTTMWGFLKIVAVLALIIFVCAVVLLIKKMGKQISELQGKNKEQENPVEQLKSEIDNLKRELCELKKSSQAVTRVQHPEPTNRANAKTRPPEQVIKPDRTPAELPNPIYLKHFKDGVLKEVEKEQAFFQITSYAGETEGYFEFIGDAPKAIALKTSELDGVCDTNGSSANATQIETERKGICVKQPDRRWLVTKKAILSFK